MSHSRHISRNSTRARLGIMAVILAALLLGACSSAPGSDRASEANGGGTPVPTPAIETLVVTGTTASGERLRVIIPAITVAERAEGEPVRVFVALVDPGGTYSYLLYPANRPGEDADRIALAGTPLEIGVTESTPRVALWAFAYTPTGSAAADALGLDAIATSLALSFREWLIAGDAADDPLAGTVTASDGALFEWFAEIDVLGQELTWLDPGSDWGAELGAVSSPDGALSVVFDVDYFPAGESTPAIGEPDTEAEASLTPEATDENAPYVLVLDETFDDNTAAERWYQGRAETFVNEILGGGYQIRLLGSSRRPVALSWGSLSGLRTSQARVEAEMRVTEGDSSDTIYGLWLRYQDDNNFLYVGLSSRGAYRIAIVSNNRVQRVIQDWQFHPAIGTGSAANTLSVEMSADGRHEVRVNDVFLLSFLDRTYGEGSIAFFCSARVTPATCRLESLRIWQPPS